MPEKAWDWAAEQQSLVIPAVSAVAVYTNPNGDVVIRQQDPYGEEDSFVIIPRKMADKVAKALKDEAKKPFEPDQE